DDLAHILANGTVDPSFNPPSPNNSVTALAASASTLYASGYFTSIGGLARNRIAAFDATTGAVTAWDANADCCVSALAVSGSTVYAGGSFSSIGGKARHSIAALHRTTGEATSWNPNAHGTATSWDFDSSRVDALAVSGSTVYAGGTFASIRHK